MTEHEKLKQICDKIGYEYYKYKYEIPYNLDIDKVKIDKDVREIIFTPEFMDKMNWYLSYSTDLGPKETSHKLGSIVFLGLINPTQYLYNLLNLGKQNKN